jgi:anti-sigma B factor antagonist
MLGSSLDPIIVPIVTAIFLAVPIIMVFYADSHPTWKGGRAATRSSRPGTVAASRQRPAEAAHQAGEPVSAGQAAACAAPRDHGPGSRNGLARDVPVVAAPAEVDITTAERLRALLLKAASANHPTIVVDMTGTRFCDSSGLTVLVRAYRRAVAEGGELRLAVPAGGPVRRILALTCADRLIPCFVNVEDALARQSSPAPPAVLVDAPAPRR